MVGHELVLATRVLDAVWGRFEAAAGDSFHPFRHFTLATADAGAVPRARIMTLRGVDRSRARLWLHSHQHSAKVSELKSNPPFAATFFDGECMVSVQARGTATCHLLDSDAVAQFRDGWASAGRTEADLLWPGSSEALQHAITRRAFREFVAIALTIDELIWMQVAGGSSLHVRLAEREAWQPEIIRD